MLLFVNERGLYCCIYFSLNLFYYISKPIKGELDMFVMARESALNKSATDVRACFLISVARDVELWLTKLDLLKQKN